MEEHTPKGKNKLDELDPVQYEIFYQRLDKMLNEAKEVVRYLSAGMITREAGEVQEAFYLPNGEAALIAAGILMHIMNVTRVIRYMTEENYDSEDIGINEGDQFINNDAYIGGMHCQDTSVIRTLFYKGEHLGYTAAVSHTTDVGGIESVGVCPSARESIHDGLHLNAIKLVENGKIRRDVFNMILRAVRDSTYVELDIRARMAGNERANRRLLELIEDVGPDFFKKASAKLIDDAEIFARDRIKTLRKGIYRARVYDDCAVLQQGELRERLAVIEIEIEVTEKGDFLVRVPVVSPENEGFNNAYLPAIEATVFYTLLDLILYDCRWNSGFARAIKIDFVPDKSRLSASPYRSTNYASVGIGSLFCNVLTEAISRALYVSGRYADVAGAATVCNSSGLGGENQYGKRVVQTIASNFVPCGIGALVDHDGIDSSITMYNPWSYVTDAESEELGLPIIHLSRNHRPDTGGFGKFRGGNGVTHVTMIHDSPSIGLTKYGTGNKMPSNQGLFGGYPGAASYFELFRDTDVYQKIEQNAPLPFEPEEVGKLIETKAEHYAGHTSCTERVLKSGDIWVSPSHGGGAGLGDPIERDPDLIVRDLEDQMVTGEVAQNVYAAVIDPESLAVDYKETEKLRAERRAERLKTGIPGLEYVRRMVQQREAGEYPGFIKKFYEETVNFCPSFSMELEREKQIARNGLNPPKDVTIKEKLFSLTPYVDIMLDETDRKLAVCSHCGYIYCEDNDNYKLYCLIYDRNPSHFHPGNLAYDDEWCVFREFYCPSCAAQIEVEAVPHGAPILWAYELKY